MIFPGFALTASSFEGLTLCNSFKDYICLAFSLVEGFGKGSQPKEVTIESL